MAIPKKCRYCDQWVRMMRRAKGDCIHHAEQTGEDFGCDRFIPNQPSRSLDFHNKCAMAITLGLIIAGILKVICRI